MKIILLSLLLVHISFLGFAQVEQIDNTQSQQKEPETVEANLNMIVPPATFEVSDAFNGYISLQNSSAIMMTQINNYNYLNFVRGMNEEFYTQNQLHFISKETFVSENGVKGTYFKLYFEQKGDRYIRYMVYAGDLTTTLWLNITYPEMLEELIEMEIIKSIQTINLKP